jgi:small subunit ribosomal protein S21
MTLLGRPSGNTFSTAHVVFQSMEQTTKWGRNSLLGVEGLSWAFGLDGASRPMSNPRFPTRTRTHHLEERCLETLLGRPLEVEVRDSVDKALKILKQKMSKEGILQEIKRRRYYEKPSVKRKRKMREARKRRRREAKRRVVR